MRSRVSSDSSRTHRIRRSVDARQLLADLNSGRLEWRWRVQVVIFERVEIEYIRDHRYDILAQRLVEREGRQASHRVRRHDECLTSDLRTGISTSRGRNSRRQCRQAHNRNKKPISHQRHSHRIVETGEERRPGWGTLGRATPLLLPPSLYLVDRYRKSVTTSSMEMRHHVALCQVAASEHCKLLAIMAGGLRLLEHCRRQRGQGIIRASIAIF